MSPGELFACHEHFRLVKDSVTLQTLYGLMANQKSLFLTYVIWLIWGWLGLHHLYLGRDIQAFVWLSTFGGVFGLGWCRDLWRIPEYVDDANEERYFVDELERKVRLRKEPAFSVTRFAGQMLVGYFYGILVRLAIPEEARWLPALLVPLGVAIGVYLVGNIGHERGDFKYPLGGSFIANIVLTYLTGDEAGAMYVALFAAMCFQYHRQFKEKPQKKTFCKRLQYLALGCLIICSLWGSFLYFNAQVTTEDGETVKLRDAVNHFFNSPVWLEFKEVLWGLYEEGQRNGWDNFYDEFVKALDPRGEKNAYRILGLTEDATQEEIKRRYKKLAVKWHPDRNPNNKDEAQEKFMEIQEAYEILSNIKTMRASRNTRTRSDFDEHDHTEF